MNISVVVPVRNEEDSIRLLLDSLLNQTRQPDEIVITDGGSTDATPIIIEEYIKGGAPVHLIRERAALPGRGRNLAAARASSDWLAFTDAGIHPTKSWLAALAKEATDDPTVDVVFGSWEPVTDTFFKECAAIAYVIPPVEVDGKPMRNRSISSTLMRRDVWRAVNGFSEHLRSAEDILFINSIEESSFRVHYAPDALVRWNIQPTLGRTFQRFASYSLHNIRAGLWRQWQRPILLRYLAVALALPVALVLWRHWIVLLFSVWVLMLILRSLVAMQRNRGIYPGTSVRNILRLPVVVVIIATLDIATITGSVNWLITDKLHAGRTASGC